jgi:hypothetical protein
MLEFRDPIPPLPPPALQLNDHDFGSVYAGTSVNYEGLTPINS